MYSGKCACFSCPILVKFDFLDKILENTQISNSIKVRLMAAELFHADRRTDRYDEANSCSSQFCERA